MVSSRESRDGSSIVCRRCRKKWTNNRLGYCTRCLESVTLPVQRPKVPNKVVVK